MEASALPGQKEINFCLYSRKSTENDELQALSIDSQTKEMLAIAERDKLKVSHSSIFHLSLLVYLETENVKVNVNKFFLDL